MSGVREDKSHFLLQTLTSVINLTIFWEKRRTGVGGKIKNSSISLAQFILNKNTAIDFKKKNLNIPHKVHHWQQQLLKVINRYWKQEVCQDQHPSWNASAYISATLMSMAQNYFKVNECCEHIATGVAIHFLRAVSVPTQQLRNRNQGHGHMDRVLSDTGDWVAARLRGLFTKCEHHNLSQKRGRKTCPLANKKWHKNKHNGVIP